MRPVLLPALITLVAGPAAAGSIETIVTGTASTTASSIETITCQTCVDVPKKVADGGYRVPAITPGTERREIRTVNGEMKLVRTEAWLGGSPVTFVSSLPPDLFRGMDTATGGSLAAAATTSVGTLIAAGGIDTAAQTASVASATGTPDATQTAADVRSQVFDPDTLQLRVQ
ncbi:hypothetical protein SAMN05880582_106121 [Rhizobium sp. RU20A]|uniref:plant virulence effector HPE1-like domain-containing protein n=1 Tax=Rhizobium sp. RU20A TaxID=1907412 RepID=UPI000956A528|nr:plant virulence effector HPE1-like domain-containing protein [Rhizobium sp. RU20A]SIR08735.1 hypothetical protein SAMN05880582_106121 [Rhizobium sp. RU20A]